MKTFSDVKRRLRVGAVLECVENTYQPKLNGTRRKVEVVQTNAVAFQRAQDDGSFLPEIPRRDLFWLYYPKTAKHVSVIDADTFRMDLDTGRGDRLTLRFVEEAP